MDLTWIKTDKFYLSLSKDDQIGVLTVFMQYGHDNGSRQTRSGLFHGQVKYCPTCAATRFTNCVACGCGTCYTCNYHFICRPVDLSQFTSYPVKLTEPIYIPAMLYNDYVMNKKFTDFSREP